MSLPGARTPYDWRAFSIAGIPVTFSAWYLMLVWATFGRAASAELGFVHLLTVTASVLVHELGHAWPARRRRLKPRILLHGFGGWCEHETPYSRNDALVITAGGPLAGLALGAVAWGLGYTLRDAPWWLEVALWDLAWMGLFWSCVNLLPILPLDGGSLCENLLERRHRLKDPRRVARVVGVVAAGLAAVGAIALGEVTLVLLMLVLGWSNAASLGWVPAIPGMHVVHGAAPAARARGGRSQPPPWTVIGLVAVLGLPVVLRAFVDVEGPLTSWLAVRGGALAQPWRLVLWPLVPAGRPITLLSALLALGLVGPTVDRVRGRRGFVVLGVVATLAAGLAGAAVTGARRDGVLAGPVALTLAYVAAWASLRRQAPLGPSVIPVSPAVLLVAVVAVDLADRWASSDATGAAADVAGVVTGLLFATKRAKDAAWRLEVWWRLRNPPPVQIGRNR